MAGESNEQNVNSNEARSNHSVHKTNTELGLPSTELEEPSGLVLFWPNSTRGTVIVSYRAKIDRKRVHLSKQHIASNRRQPAQAGPTVYNPFNTSLGDKRRLRFPKDQGRNKSLVEILY